MEEAGGGGRDHNTNGSEQCGGQTGMGRGVEGWGVGSQGGGQGGGRRGVKAKISTEGMVVTYQGACCLR